MTSKNDILMSNLMFFHQKSSCCGTLLTPHFRPVLLLLQTTWALEKSRRPWFAVQCHASQHSSRYLVPGHGECGGKQVLSWAHSLALSKCSDVSAQFWADFQNCSAHAIYWERWIYTSWKRGQIWMDPRSWRTSLTLVELGFKTVCFVSVR